MDDVDIYNDLDDFAENAKCSEILAEKEVLVKQNQELQEKLDEQSKQIELKLKEIEHLKTENITLKRNISSLFKTATKETRNKSKIIADLKSEIDSLKFRRNKQTNFNNNRNEFFENSRKRPLDKKNITESNPKRLKSENYIENTKSSIDSVPPPFHTKTETVISKPDTYLHLIKAVPDSNSKSIEEDSKKLDLKIKNDSENTSVPTHTSQQLTTNHPDWKLHAENRAEVGLTDDFEKSNLNQHLENINQSTISNVDCRLAVTDFEKIMSPEHYDSHINTGPLNFDQNENHEIQYKKPKRISPDMAYSRNFEDTRNISYKNYKYNESSHHENIDDNCSKGRKYPDEYFHPRKDRNAFNDHIENIHSEVAHYINMRNDTYKRSKSDYSKSRSDPYAGSRSDNRYAHEFQDSKYSQYRSRDSSCGRLSPTHYNSRDQAGHSRRRSCSPRKEDKNCRSSSPGEDRYHRPRSPPRDDKYHRPSSPQRGQKYRKSPSSRRDDKYRKPPSPRRDDRHRRPSSPQRDDKYHRSPSPRREDKYRRQTSPRRGGKYSRPSSPQKVEKYRRSSPSEMYRKNSNHFDLEFESKYRSKSPMPISLSYRQESPAIDRKSRNSSIDRYDQRSRTPLNMDTYQDDQLAGASRPEDIIDQQEIYLPFIENRYKLNQRLSPFYNDLPTKSIEGYPHVDTPSDVNSVESRPKSDNQDFNQLKFDDFCRESQEFSTLREDENQLFTSKAPPRKIDLESYRQRNAHSNIELCLEDDVVPNELVIESNTDQSNNLKTDFTDDVRTIIANRKKNQNLENVNVLPENETDSIYDARFIIMEKRKKMEKSLKIEIDTRTNIKQIINAVTMESSVIKPVLDARQIINKRKQCSVEDYKDTDMEPAAKIVEVRTENITRCVAKDFFENNLLTEENVQTQSTPSLNTVERQNSIQDIKLKQKTQENVVDKTLVNVSKNEVIKNYQDKKDTKITNDKLIMFHSKCVESKKSRTNSKEKKSSTSVCSDRDETKSKSDVKCEPRKNILIVNSISSKNEIKSKMLDNKTKLDPKMSDTKTKFKSKMFDKLNSKMCDTKTKLDTNVSDIKTKLDSKMSDTKTKLSSKMFDTKTKLNTAMSDIKTKLDSKMSDTKTKLDSKMSDSKTKLDSKMSDSKTKLDSKMSDSKTKLDSKMSDSKPKSDLKMSDSKTKYNLKISDKLDSKMCDNKTKLDSNVSNIKTKPDSNISENKSQRKADKKRETDSKNWKKAGDIFKNKKQVSTNFKVQVSNACKNANNIMEDIINCKNAVTSKNVPTYDTFDYKNAHSKIIKDDTNDCKNICTKKSINTVNTIDCKNVDSKSRKIDAIYSKNANGKIIKANLNDNKHRVNESTKADDIIDAENADNKTIQTDDISNCQYADDKKSSFKSRELKNDNINIYENKNEPIYVSQSSNLEKKPNVDNRTEKLISARVSSENSNVTNFLLDNKSLQFSTSTEEKNKNICTNIANKDVPKIIPGINHESKHIRNLKKLISAPIIGETISEDKFTKCSVTVNENIEVTKLVKNDKNKYKRTPEKSLENITNKLKSKELEKLNQSVLSKDNDIDDLDKIMRHLQEGGENISKDTPTKDQERPHEVETSKLANNSCMSSDEISFLIATSISVMSEENNDDLEKKKRRKSYDEKIELLKNDLMNEMENVSKQSAELSDSVNTTNSQNSTLNEEQLQNNSKSSLNQNENQVLSASNSPSLASETIIKSTSHGIYTREVIGENKIRITIRRNRRR